MKYYLTFNFECGQDIVYECESIKVTSFDTRKPAMIVKVMPKIKYINKGKEIISSYAILTHKYGNQNILNYDKNSIPTIVYVAFLKNDNMVGCSELEVLRADMLINWAIGEIYDDYDDAVNHCWKWS